MCGINKHDHEILELIDSLVIHSFCASGVCQCLQQFIFDLRKLVSVQPICLHTGHPRASSALLYCK